MKRLLSLLLTAALLASLTACKKENTPALETTEPTTAASPTIVGKAVALCLPAQEEPWTTYGTALMAQLESQGHEAEVLYAQNDAWEQARQITAAAEAGTSCMVLVPVDALALSDALREAAKAGMKVLTLNRQMSDSRDVTAAVSFDYEQMGKTMANQIVQAKDLENAGKKKYTIEFLMGSTDDHRAILLHKGLMSVLQTYLDSGVLVCKTGRTALEDTYVQGWDTAKAKKTCKYYLKSYSDETVDILCAASDAIAQGCIEALEAAGYTEKDWPVITGQGGEAAALRAIADGKQASTICLDTAALWTKCAELVHLLLADSPLPAGDSSDPVPMYFCPVNPVYGPEAVKDLLPPETPPETTAPPETTTPPETTEPPVTTVPAETTTPKEH